MTIDSNIPLYAFLPPVKASLMNDDEVNDHMSMNHHINSNLKPGE